MNKVENIHQIPFLMFLYNGSDVLKTTASVISFCIKTGQKVEQNTAFSDVNKIVKNDIFNPRESISKTNYNDFLRFLARGFSYVYNGEINKIGNNFSDNLLTDFTQVLVKHGDAYVNLSKKSEVKRVISVIYQAAYSDSRLDMYSNYNIVNQYYCLDPNHQGRSCSRQSYYRAIMILKKQEILIPIEDTLFKRSGYKKYYFDKYIAEDKFDKVFKWSVSRLLSEKINNKKNSNGFYLSIKMNKIKMSTETKKLASVGVRFKKAQKIGGFL